MEVHHLKNGVPGLTALMTKAEMEELKNLLVIYLLRRIVILAGSKVKSFMLLSRSTVISGVRRSLPLMGLAMSRACSHRRRPVGEGHGEGELVAQSPTAAAVVHPMHLMALDADLQAQRRIFKRCPVCVPKSYCCQRIGSSKERCDEHN